MITQKAISVKMDAVTLEELDRECYFHGKKRNRVINDAVEHYMKHLDKVREEDYWKTMPQGRVDERYHALGKYILCNLTDKENFQVKFIANGTGTESENVLLLLIRRGLEEFDKRPFSYL